MDNEAAAHRLSETMRERDFEGMAEVLAPDVVLNSPITESFHFNGRDDVLAILKLVRGVLERPPEYQHVFGSGEMWTQVNRTSVRGREVQANVLLRFGDEGRIREMTIFFRPLPGLATLAAALAGPVARRRGRALAVVLGLLARPMAAQTRYGDALVGRLLGPAWDSTSRSTRSS